MQREREMNQIERFSTAGMNAAHRLPFWNQIAEQAFVGTRVRSDDPLFIAEMWRWRLGDIVMLRPRSPSATVERSASDADGGDPSDRLVLHIQHRGRSRFRQGAREAELSAGDMEINFSPKHYRLDLAGPNDILSVDMPAQPLMARVASLNDRICLRIPAQSWAVQMLHNYVLSLWQSGQNSLCVESGRQDAVEAFYCLVAAALRDDDHNSRERTLLTRLKAVIAARLDDPGLDTTLLAAETSVSPRSVQAAFAEIGSTPSTHINELRLERAAQWLRIYPARSVTDIAFAVGFNDSAYFSRCFRNRFGTSPRAWRQH